MATGPLELRVWTVRHGEIVVDVPAGDPGGTTDLGDVVVPDVGVLYGLVTIGDGRTPAAAGMGGLRVEVRGAEGGEMHEVEGDGRFQVTLPKRPAADAALVVTSTSPEKELVRVPWPFDLGTRDHPLPVTIPAEAVPNPSAPSDDGDDAPR